jgi:hypothetical protein
MLSVAYARMQKINQILMKMKENVKVEGLQQPLSRENA